MRGPYAAAWPQRGSLRSSATSQCSPSRSRGTSERWDLRKTATPERFCPCGSHSPPQLPSVTGCSRFLWSLRALGSAGGSRVKHGMLRASCLQSQARQPGHHAGVQGRGLIPPGDRDKPLWQQCGLTAAAQMALSTVGQVPSPVLVPPALPDTSWCPKSLTRRQRQLLSQVTAATS